MRHGTEHLRTIVWNHLCEEWQGITFYTTILLFLLFFSLYEQHSSKTQMNKKCRNDVLCEAMIRQSCYIYGYFLAQ